MNSATKPAPPIGTIVSGTIAVLTALVISLVSIGGVSMPLRTFGPGAIIILGLLLGAVGLFSVLRANRATHQAAAHNQSDAGAASPTSSPAEAPPAAEPPPAAAEHSEPLAPSDQGLEGDPAQGSESGDESSH